MYALMILYSPLLAFPDFLLLQSYIVKGHKDVLPGSEVVAVAVEYSTMGGMGTTCTEVRSGGQNAVESRMPGGSQLGCDDVAVDVVADAAKSCAVGGTTHPCAEAVSANGCAEEYHVPVSSGLYFAAELNNGK